jgi:hypothetical protein
VSRYCAGHAPCPVLVVPPEEAAPEEVSGPASRQTPQAGTPATADIPQSRSGGPRELAKT